MTACALCRREQVINPELLRARFDEQRMLNLAQRLALPPPTRTCTTSMGTAAGVLGCKRDSTNAPSCTMSESERKSGEVGNEEMATDSLMNVEPRKNSDHLLYGPSSDVGAMPADELRLWWKCIGEHLATSTSAETVGATSAAELRSSWRRLKCVAMTNMAGVRNVGEYVGSPLHVSRYEDVRGRSGIDGWLCDDGHLEVEMNFEGRTPDSLCAGASSLNELSGRWRSLTRLCSAGSAIPDQGVHHHYPSTSTIGKMDWIQPHAECSVPPESSFDSVSDIRAHAAYVDDVGGLSNAYLRKRWAKAFGPIDKGGDVGELEVHQLSTRLGLAIESQSVGALSPSSLKERWNALRSGALESESCPELIKNGRKVMGYSLSELGTGFSRGYVDFGADTAAASLLAFKQAPLG